jgi:hypothetical protein
MALYDEQGSSSKLNWSPSGKKFLPARRTPSGLLRFRDWVHPIASRSCERRGKASNLTQKSK